MTGRRDIADRLLGDACTRGKEHRDQVRADVEHGRHQAQSARESSTSTSYDDQPTVHIQQPGPTGTTGGSSTC